MLEVRVMTNEEKILELLSAMNGRMNHIETDVSGMKTDMSGLKTDVSGLKTDVSGMKNDISGLHADVAGIRMDIEGRIDPQLQALAEGQKTILETLAPKNRVEALEDEVDFMKRVVNSLAREVDELKKED